MSEITLKDVLDYHGSGRPGKIEVTPTKKMETQRDLSLAYSPGVAKVVEYIEQNPEAAYEYTTRGNLVAVVTNGNFVGQNVVIGRGAGQGRVHELGVEAPVVLAGWPVGQRGRNRTDRERQASRHA